MPSFSVLLLPPFGGLSRCRFRVSAARRTPPDGSPAVVRHVLDCTGAAGAIPCTRRDAQRRDYAAGSG
uniref:Putative secreted peptide n=1 Tax=Anopheles braziliensis TaxID=58242 RepID=A0A2M3ZR74_9DIPT